jgi:hypothetical protein
MTADRPPVSDFAESRKERTERVAAVSQRVREVFAEAVAQLGMRDAKRIWNDAVSNHKRKRGKPKKSERSGWDGVFLEFYEQSAADPHPETLIRELAQFFYRANRVLPKERRFASPQAIEKKIRRLVADRKGGKLKRVGTAEYKYVSRSGGQ